MEKRTFPVNSFGYVTTWLVSGPLETPVDPSARTIVDQYQYECYMRQNSHDDDVKQTPANITLGASGLAGMPWRYYQAGENYFVDCSRFYHTMYKCEFWGATVLVSPKEQQLALDVWSYTATDLWLNGEHIFCEPICVYSPMRRARVEITLNAGENLLFMRMQNSCTRDTRSIAAVSVVGGEDIRAAYPGEQTDELNALIDASDWLASVRYNGKSLTAPSAPSLPVSFSETALCGHPWTEGAEYVLPEKQCAASLSVNVAGTTLIRKLEMTDRILPPAEVRWNSVEECRAAVIAEIADCPVPEKLGNNGNMFYNVYARLALGRPCTADDERVIDLACDEAVRHCDCSDFRLCYLLKAVCQKLPLSEKAAKTIHDAAIGYSYWFDEPAVGAMCYNSENHALLFHSSQLIAGRLWPDEIFTRTGRTGRQQEEIARALILNWIGKIEEKGFAEFLSGGYTIITAAAILAVYDCCGDAEMTARCGKLLDRIFCDLALNTFDGVVSCPQGRVYRTVLTPWTNSTQALFYFATGRGAPANSEWLAAFAGTGYTIPSDVYEKSLAPGMTSYFSAGTKIQTYKSEGFMITSLPVPVVGEGAPGTFLPGVCAYQEHLFYACLGGACNLFIHHPGGSHDGTQIRPGYWYGNGYFPTVHQYDKVLAAIYRLDRDHPISFTHMFFPEGCFDETVRDGNWIFARRGTSYAAVWCSRELTAHDSDIVQSADLRAEGGSSGWLIVCGDRTTSDSFASFIVHARENSPVFDEDALTLTFADKSIEFGK